MWLLSNAVVRFFH